MLLECFNIFKGSKVPFGKTFDDDFGKLISGFMFIGLQFPIGIDSDRFIRALEVPQVQEHIRELKERFAGRKVGVIFLLCYFLSFSCKSLVLNLQLLDGLS